MLGQHAQPAGLSQGSPAHAAVSLFDLSLLRYKERDVLVEALQSYRTKAKFDIAAAWEGRCRKWYADRYDFRQNMVDWDYHMRLSTRGTPSMDPTAGSIIHFYHFRHWRMTGVAYELRESSYTATNTTMLATAYGRTREYKDRNLRDVGRSVSAYGYWGEILNPPYHAFGTVADDPALFKLVNKQFSHTSVDVAEHNILAFIACLCPSSDTKPAAAAAAAGGGGAAGPVPASGHASSTTPSTTSGTPAHRARAAQGPTSLEGLAAAVNSATDLQASQAQHSCSAVQQHSTDMLDCSSQPQQSGDASQPTAAAAACKVEELAPPLLPPPDAAGLTDQAANSLQELCLGCLQQDMAESCGQQQQQQAPVLSQTQQGQCGSEQEEAEAQHTCAPQHQPPLHQQHSSQRLHAADTPATTCAALQRLLWSVKIYFLTGDLKRCLTGKAGFSQRFAAATVGYRHIHLLGPDHELARVLQPDAPLLVETAANMVQLTTEQVAAFDSKLLELAAAAGFEQYTAMASAGGYHSSQERVSTQQQQQQHQKAASGAADGVGSRERSWKLPPGVMALRVRR